VVTNFSNELASSICYPEYGGNRFLGNTGAYIPDYTNSEDHNLHLQPPSKPLISYRPCYVAGLYWVKVLGISMSYCIISGARGGVVG
jgi:hypothetical protein